MKAIFEMVLRMPIEEVKKVMDAEAYEELRAMANEEQKIVIDAMASQIMKEEEEQVSYAMFSDQGNKIVGTRVEELRKQNQAPKDYLDFNFFGIHFSDIESNYPEVMDTDVRETIANTLLESQYKEGKQL